MADHVETLGVQDTPELRDQEREDVISKLGTPRLWVLDDRHPLVATTGFNAMLPDCVQVGGVHTWRSATTSWATTA